MNSDYFAPPLENISFVEDRHLHASFSMKSIFLIKLQQLNVWTSCSREGRIFLLILQTLLHLLAEIPSLHSSAFLPLAAIAFLLTTAK